MHKFSPLQKKTGREVCGFPSSPTCSCPEKANREHQVRFPNPLAFKSGGDLGKPRLFFQMMTRQKTFAPTLIRDFRVVNVLSLWDGGHFFGDNCPCNGSAMYHVPTSVMRPMRIIIIADCLRHICCDTKLETQPVYKIGRCLLWILVVF